MKYSRENLPPIGLIFSDSGGSYEIIGIEHGDLKLKNVVTRKLYDYTLNSGIDHLNNSNWTIKKIPSPNYEIY